MIKENQYIRLHEVLSRALRHPLLQDMSLEAAAQYAVDFIHAVGTPDMFEDREAEIEIHNYRGKLPCDIIAINQVMDLCTHTCMRAMTDTFFPADNHHCPYGHHYGELTFKTQNTIIYTSMKEGKIKMSYKAIPVDEDGFPLLIDNPTYLKALELYIKKEAFTILFDTGKIQAGVMNKAESDYAWKVGQLQSEMTIPSESEMEAICRSWTTLIQRTTDFDKDFKHLGNREYIRNH